MALVDVTKSCLDSISQVRPSVDELRIEWCSFSVCLVPNESIACK